MRKTILFTALTFSLILTACTSEDLDQTLLYGSWKVDQFLESGQPKKLDISKMGFTFDSQNVYTYQSNLKFREAGNYRINGSVLYSTDTLNNERIEKAVKIASITSDSLHLLMNNGGVEQEILLHKLK